MCRLLGFIASEPTEFRVVLRDVPRSLAVLSEEHPDGWGLAVYDESDGWMVRKGTDTALRCQHFHSCATTSRGVVLLSHVRLKTVGVTSLENTHPFQSDGWVFAHNGTIRDIAFLKDGISPLRMSAVRGETDSELFFAWLMTALDHENAKDGDARTDRVVRDLVDGARARRDFGAFNFLLSNGDVTYAHRLGRSLHLARGPRDGLLIASEQMTDEPWEEVPEGTLLRIDRRPSPAIRAV